MALTGYRLNNLVLNIFISLVLIIGHYFNNGSLILISLIAFLLQLIWSKINCILPNVFYFISFTNILKLDYGNNSWLTFSIIAIVLKLIIFEKIKKEYLVLFFVFLGYTVVIKLLNGDSFSFRYVTILIDILFLFLIATNVLRYNNYNLTVIYFIIGLLVANLSSIYLSDLYHMEEYFASANYFNYRAVGYFWDPNRNAIFLSMALLCLLYLKRSNKIFKIVLAISLIYFLISTNSKMGLFLLCIISIYYIGYIKYNTQNIIAYSIVVTVGVVFMLNYTNVVEEIFFTIERFGSFNTIDTVTTGRINILTHYINYISSNPEILLVGTGYITNSLVLNEYPHNSYVEIIYHLGIFGGFLFCYLIFKIFKNAKFNDTDIYSYSGIVILMISMIPLHFITHHEFYYLVILSYIIYVRKSNA